MRWIWIDRILELERGSRAVAVKNVAAWEEMLHDQFPPSEGYPATAVMPNPLIIEGMAQTAGILVGHARDYQEKVILAKVGKAVFHAAARPGWAIHYIATVDRLDDSGASTSGACELVDPAGIEATTPLAEMTMMFSHIDNNRAGIEFPEHNFVFTKPFLDIIVRSGFET